MARTVEVSYIAISFLEKRYEIAQKQDARSGSKPANDKKIGKGIIYKHGKKREPQWRAKSAI